MSINRLLSRRDRSKSSREKSKTRVEEVPETPRSYLNGYFWTEEGEKLKEPDPRKIASVSELLQRNNVRPVSDQDIKYALCLLTTEGHIFKTIDFLKRLQDSIDLIIRPYDPSIIFLGAVNRNSVSCWLDSVLFALFGCQDSYEPMLAKSFEDKKLERLATLLRLWVNTQRAGVLVSTDITWQILKALADCGWDEARENRQQDAGEAFGFITEQLGLPNLFLKMDLFHDGKEDTTDDHKIVQERLLEMPVPDPPEDGSAVTIEHCFEMALNAKVEVKRFLEGRERRSTLDRMNTVGSARSQRTMNSSKGHYVHIESVEVAGSEPPTPLSAKPQSPPPPYDYKGSLTLISRTPSVIKEKAVYDKAVEAGFDGHSELRARAGSIKTEVLIPAWQMYSLIPFHSDYEPSNDAQVANHFKVKQPTFGIRLKRYGMGKDGKPFRSQTCIDIPVDMALPSFIREDNDEEEFGVGKFKLSLLSAVCHRGTSVDAGHYVCLARGRNKDGEDLWSLFDDIAGTRVKAVDIDQALKKETPYLLFYQVLPIEGEAIIIKPESPIGSLLSSSRKDSAIAGISLRSPLDKAEIASNVSEGTRPSLEDAASFESRRGRTSYTRDERPVLTLTETSANGRPVTGYVQHPQNTHKALNSLSDDKRTFTGKESRLSQSTFKDAKYSPTRENRLSLSLTRLTERFSSGNIITDGIPFEITPSRPPQNRVADIVVAAGEKEGKLKKREKSKNRKSGHGHNHSKLKRDGTAPDRECILM